jgi:peptide-methionine (S)-S-oxide reductase
MVLAPTPAPQSDATKKLQTAVFAGGCFWGVEAVFEHVNGVIDVRSGYSGGGAKDADYDKVSSGATKHAEAVRITFDPAKVTYVQLLTVFFSVAHDPTQLNRQGPDVGPQYRSAIFYASDEQKKLATSYIDAINKSKALTKPVVTELAPLTEFFEAEKYHQDYLVKNPDQPYIVIHDMPKLAALKERFPDIYVEKK